MKEYTKYEYLLKSDSKASKEFWEKVFKVMQERMENDFLYGVGNDSPVNDADKPKGFLNYGLDFKAIGP